MICTNHELTKEMVSFYIQRDLIVFSNLLQYFNRLTENNMNTEQFSFLFILDLFKSWWICFVLFTSQAIWFVLTKSQGIWFEIMICVHIILFWSNDLPTSWSDKRNGLLLSESQGIWFEIMIRVHIVFF